MKKLFVLLFALILVGNVAVSAQEPGITPGNAFWGLDVAFDKLSLALTADDTKRAEKALDIARERLAEIEAVTEKGNVEQAKRAQKEHANLMQRLEKNIAKIGDDNESYKASSRLETELSKHQETVNKFRLRVKGNLNNEQQNALDTLIATLGDDVSDVEIRIKKKNDDVRIRLQERLSEDEIKSLEGDRYVRLVNVAQAQAEREISRAKEKVAEFETENKPNLITGQAVSQRAQETTIRREDRADIEKRANTEPVFISNITDNQSDDMNESDDNKNKSNNNRVDDDNKEERESDDEREREDETSDEINESDDNKNKSNNNRVDDDNKEERESDDDTKESDGNILRQYNLSVPEYEKRGVNISKKFISQAENALERSYSMEASENYRKAYAYAKFAKKLANNAMKGKYLHLTDAQEDRLEAIEEERERIEEQEEERLEALEDAECKTDSDCESDEFCAEDLECEKMECQADNDCDNDEYCTEEFECEDKEDLDSTELECATDSDCDSNEYCSSENECEDSDEKSEDTKSEELECQADNDCDNDEYCSNKNECEDKEEK